MFMQVRMSGFASIATGSGGLEEQGKEGTAAVVEAMLDGEGL